MTNANKATQTNKRCIFLTEMLVARGGTILISTVLLTAYLYTHTAVANGRLALQGTSRHDRKQHVKRNILRLFSFVCFATRVSNLQEHRWNIVAHFMDKDAREKKCKYLILLLSQQ